MLTFHFCKERLIFLFIYFFIFLLKTSYSIASNNDEMVLKAFENYSQWTLRFLLLKVFYSICCGVKWRNAAGLHIQKGMKSTCEIYLTR